jgi:cell wall-associated NlpC family hydrolase
VVLDMRKRLRHAWGFALIVAAMSLLALPAAAEGDPPPAPAPGVEDLKAQAADIQGQLEINGAKISALAEEYNLAQLHLDEVQGQIDKTQVQILLGEREVIKRQRLVNERAASAYMSVRSGTAFDVADLADPQDRNTHSVYADVSAQADKLLVSQLMDARKRLATRKAELEVERDGAQTERDRIAEAQARVQKANLEQAYLYNSAKFELKRAIAEQDALWELDAAARYEAGLPPPEPLPETPGGSEPFVPTLPDPPPVNPPPPPNAKAALAVQFAYAQLGKAYVYAAAGPDTFDCSGLTMRAWEAAGVSMPHYSGAQYAMFPHVALDALELGDLVFYGPGGSQHVGIYIGEGKMIHAPRTGDVVKIGSIYRPLGGPVGAARPG